MKPQESTNIILDIFTNYSWGLNKAKTFKLKFVLYSFLNAFKNVVVNL